MRYILIGKVNGIIVSIEEMENIIEKDRIKKLIGNVLHQENVNIYEYKVFVEFHLADYEDVVNITIADDYGNIVASLKADKNTFKKLTRKEVKS